MTNNVTIIFIFKDILDQMAHKKLFARACLEIKNENRLYELPNFFALSISSSWGTTADTIL